MMLPRCLYSVAFLNMNVENTCHCSIEALQIGSELQNVHAVVDVETILDLIHRVCRQGQIIVRCKSCTKTSQSSLVTLPALSEQCLPLLEALCSAYNISTQPSFFDSAILAFEQPPSPLFCIRSQVLLGRTELDEDETRLLVRTLIGRSLMRLVELMENLKAVLLALLENSQTHRNGLAAIQAYESSVESTIGRLAVLMQIIEGEAASAPLT
ncbi:uncharacterized protein N7459_002412 [Penicillium hispanicum]|uniref:uncharacterized protein n=1 Tax=Penicillium hispanicum TaxID=1080232 RepID=UPI0025424185|nr:uncharacterized protein N7459_002412 [Penicillium hispanicum]KAJ5592043.1 hypothetical protein N7459_002412 [Penicillium hispanicum]